MKKLIKLLMIPLMVFSLFSCGNGSGSSSSGGSNTPASMKDLFNDEIVLSSATGKTGLTMPKEEIYLLDDLMSNVPMVPKQHYWGMDIRTNETVYISSISFKILSDFEFYIKRLGICDSEANWDYDGYSKDENGKWIFEPDGSVNYHIVPGEEISLSFTFDNFRVKRMRNLIITIYPMDDSGEDFVIRDEDNLIEWKYTIYDLKIVATEK